MTWLEKPYRPQVVDDVMLAFPAQVQWLMPNPEEIPVEYRKRGMQNNASRMFFEGISGESKWWPQPGIDPATAIRHLRCILGSFEPQHEDKLTAVAFLIDEWFEKVEL